MTQLARASSAVTGNSSTDAPFTLFTMSCISWSAAACPHQPAFVEIAMSTAIADVLNARVMPRNNTIFFIFVSSCTFERKRGDAGPATRRRRQSLVAEGSFESPSLRFVPRFCPPSAGAAWRRGRRSSSGRFVSMDLPRTSFPTGQTARLLKQGNCRAS